MVWSFLYAQCTGTLVKGSRSLFESPGRKIDSIFLQCTGIFSQGTWFPFIQIVLERGSSLKFDYVAVTLCFYDQVKLAFIWSRTFFCQYRLNKNLASYFWAHHGQLVSAIGLHESGCSTLTLLFSVVRRLTWPLVVECCHWPLPLWGPITPIAFRFPNSVTAIPTVRSGLQRSYQHLWCRAKNTSAEKYSLSKGLSGHMNLENTE